MEGKRKGGIKGNEITRSFLSSNLTLKRIV